MKVIDQNSSSA